MGEQRYPVDNLTKGVDLRGRPYYWIGPIREAGKLERGTDGAALSDHKVAITPIHLDEYPGARRAAQSVRMTGRFGGPGPIKTQ